MASPAKCISRMGLSFFRQTSSRRTPCCTCPVARCTRFFSVTASTFNKAPRDARRDAIFEVPAYSPDLLTPDERAEYDVMSPEDREHFDRSWTAIAEDLNNPDSNEPILRQINQEVYEIEKETPMLFADVTPKNLGFWGEDEEDEVAQVEDDDDHFNDDAITSMAHAELEEHRELREYARVMAWDMPSLSKLAKPFILPPDTHLLRFRYTTYMGETHPAETKVVVELCSKDLTPTYLTEEQRLTFLKLVGTRYNPSTDIIRMSTEKFSTRAQNKRYLGDIVDTLIEEAKHGDSFADIPLDLRHHKQKSKIVFPKSWALTEQRKKQLDATRAERKRLERERLGIIDGNEVIREAVKKLPALSQEFHRSEDGADVVVPAKLGNRHRKLNPRLMVRR